MDPRLLIVESDNLFRSRLVDRLRHEKFDVYTVEADCRPEINKILKKNKIDVVVIDLSELKREGLMILEAIHPSRAKAEVILINSPDQLPLSIDGMKLGAYNDYLLPLDMEKFLKGLREATDKKRQLDKPSLMQTYQEIMAAVSFAEAGEHEMAKKFLERNIPKEPLDAFRKKE